MPQLTFPIGTTGLIVPVMIGLDGFTATNLHNAGQRIPPPIRARGILDTGADVTCVPLSILQQLGIATVATRPAHAVSGGYQANMVEISLSVFDPNAPSGDIFTCSDLFAMELVQSIPDADVIVGRDAILQAQLFIDGPGGQFTLTW
jgi:hypothetical protein